MELNQKLIQRLSLELSSDSEIIIDIYNRMIDDLCLSEEIYE